jgi:uncharacterized protein (DUF934 family)
MKLVDPHSDRWHPLGGDDGPPVTISAVPFALLDLAQWHAARDQWPAGVPVGVVLPNDLDPAELAADLPRLALVVLRFPKWTDGRAYSQAVLLRQRLGFGGDVRATGEVIVDMLPLLNRTGFSSALLRADQDHVSAWRALSFFDQGHYQGDPFGHRLRSALPASRASQP